MCYSVQRAHITEEISTAEHHWNVICFLSPLAKAQISVPNPQDPNTHVKEEHQDLFKKKKSTNRAI